MKILQVGPLKADFGGSGSANVSRSASNAIGLASRSVLLSYHDASKRNSARSPLMPTLNLLTNDSNANAFDGAFRLPQIDHDWLEIGIFRE